MPAAAPAANSEPHGATLQHNMEEESQPVHIQQPALRSQSNASSRAATPSFAEASAARDAARRAPFAEAYVAPTHQAVVPSWGLSTRGKGWRTEQEPLEDEANAQAWRAADSTARHHRDGSEYDGVVIADNASTDQEVVLRTSQPVQPSLAQPDAIAAVPQEASVVQVRAPDEGETLPHPELLPPPASTKNTEEEEEQEQEPPSSVYPAATPVPREFKDLQAHIEELTEEKFTLQRCLEQQTLLADRLAEENQALTARLNEAASAVEAASIEVAARRKEVASARAATVEAMAERDAYEMSARETAERAQTLAAEVVSLEEKLLKARNDALKLKVAREEGHEVDPDAAKVVAALRSQIEGLTRERGQLKDQIAVLKSELANGQLNQETRDNGDGAHLTDPGARSLTQHGNGFATAKPPSVAMAAAALTRFGATSGMSNAGIGGETLAVERLPLEVRALLPNTLWPLVNEGGDLEPGVQPLMRRICALIDALEESTSNGGGGVPVGVGNAGGHG
jgi:hypothetical protein